MLCYMNIAFLSNVTIVLLAHFTASDLQAHFMLHAAAVKSQCGMDSIPSMSKRVHLLDLQGLFCPLMWVCDVYRYHSTCMRMATPR